MKKRLLFYLFSFLVGGITAAWSTPPSVTVVDRQGNKTSVSKIDVSRISLGPDIVEIVRKDGERQAFSKKAISRILLTDSNSGLSVVSGSKISVNPRITTDIVRISGVAGHTPFYLFNITGHSILSGKCDDSITELSFSSLRNGVYLLVVGEDTFKIVKK